MQPRCANARRHHHGATKSRACQRSSGEKRERSPRRGGRCGFRRVPARGESFGYEGHGLVDAASSLNRILQLAQLHLSKSQQDMVFAGEVIEKGALADIGGVGDVFHSGLRETLLSEEVESGAKQPLADFRAAALSAADGGG